MARASRGASATCSTHVLGAVRTLNRLDCAVESLRAAMGALAVAAPGWLRVHADPSWAGRCARRAEDLHVPRGEVARRAFAEGVGRDGHALLAVVTASDAPSWLREVPAVEVLRRVWVQTFALDEGGGTASKAGRSVVRWRSQAEGFPPSLLMVASPYNPDVHYGLRSARRPHGLATRST